MNFELGFSLASMAAVLCWAALIFLPRRRWIAAGLRFGVIVGFAVVYTALVLVYFTRAEGGGFNSISQVRALFSSDATVLAGWIHYLAWDLFVGVWVAERADALGISRWVQGPILFTIFMFGPAGFLLFTGMNLALQRKSRGADPVRISKEVLS